MIVAGEGLVPVYVDILDPHNPFLDCNQMYSEIYPGGIHLDKDKSVRPKKKVCV